MTPVTITTTEQLLPLNDNPLVSILIVCKNGTKTIRRCLEAALAQTYQHFELVFQDGGSTDGTLDIVKDYMSRHPGRIRLKAEPDSCGEEGLFRGLKACEGDILVLSMADEELLPESVAWGVKQLKGLPQAGAVYGDVYVTDFDGKIVETWHGSPFSLKGYLFREVDPPFAATFFRREALIGAGLFTRDWIWGVGEFEIWLRIAMKYPVHYLPGVIAKFAFHCETASHGHFSNDEYFVSARKAFFDTFFAEPDLPESIRGMKEQAIAGLHLFIGNVLLNLEVSAKPEIHIKKALEHIPNGSQLLFLAERISKANFDCDRKMLRTDVIKGLKGHVLAFIHLILMEIYDGLNVDKKAQKHFKSALQHIQNYSPYRIWPRR
ncbi:MAG: glycosyltransferase [Desulfuromonadales bacterium]